MKKRVVFSLIVFCLGISAQFAFALDPVLPPLDTQLVRETPPNEVDLNVPSSEVSLRSGDFEQKMKTSPLEVGLGVSSWVPSNFNPSAYVNTGNFQGAGAPELELQALLPGRFQVGQFSVSPRAQLSYLGLTRSGTLLDDGASIQAVQNLYLVGVGVGGELEIERLREKTFSPFVAVIAQPVVALGMEDAFDQGSTDFGVMGQAQAGLNINLPWAPSSMGVKKTVLNLSALATAGTVKGSDLSGAGVECGLRVAM